MARRRNVRGTPTWREHEGSMLGLELRRSSRHAHPQVLEEVGTEACRGQEVAPEEGDTVHASGRFLGGAGVPEPAQEKEPTERSQRGVRQRCGGAAWRGTAGGFQPGGAGGRGPACAPTLPPGLPLRCQRERRRVPTHAAPERQPPLRVGTPLLLTSAPSGTSSIERLTASATSSAVPEGGRKRSKESRPVWLLKQVKELAW